MSKPNFSKYSFYVILFLTIFFTGYLSHKNRTFPYSFIRNQIEPRFAVALSLFSEDYRNKTSSMASHTLKVKKAPKARIKKKQVYNAPTVFGSVKSNTIPAVQIVDIDGKLIHEWELNWFNFFKDKESYKHVPKSKIPKESPGFYVGGMIVMDNGDLIVRIEGALLRLDACGNEIWRIAKGVHHTVVKDEDDILWVPTLRFSSQLKTFPRIKPGTVYEGFLKASLDGEILMKKGFFNLFNFNNLRSYLLQSSIGNLPFVRGDLIHLNDVEPFPKSMEEGFFKHGDFIASFRNLHAIMVFDKNFKVKKIVSGDFVRQHDPDFIDGNTLSIFDNNTLEKESGSSRIITKNMITDETKVVFQGTKKEPFYTRDIGNHQWLPNGNILITESRKGRIFEINSKGKIVWEYYHILDDTTLGVILESHRIAPKFTKEFFAEKRKTCEEKANS